MVTFCPGPGQDGTWYRTLAVEFEENGIWKPLPGFRTSPPLPVTDRPYDKATGVEYLMVFPPVEATAIRIGGDSQPSSGRPRAVAIAELRVYGAVSAIEKLQ